MGPSQRCVARRNCVSRPLTLCATLLLLLLAENVRRFVVQRALEKGESPVEGGERPLYSADIQNIIAAYAVEGSSEAMLRKFMVDVACLSGGRGGEMSNLTWEGLLVRVPCCRLRAYIAHLPTRRQHLPPWRLIHSTKSFTQT